MKRRLKLAAYQEALRSAGLLRRPLEDQALLEEPVTHITFDSREVTPGALFVCKGEAFRPAYLQQALERGALAWVSEEERGIAGGLLVTDIRKTMALLARELYGEPWRDYALVGLTGTKGKSTALYFLRSIVDGALDPGGEGGCLGYLSSIETYDGLERFESHLTTPEALTLAGHLDHVKEAGLFGLAMEVSSQGLKYDRTLGLEFDIGAFLNFSPDHIGGAEHRDEEDYFTAKLRFPAQCRCFCINGETAGLDRVLAAARQAAFCEKILLYSPAGKQEAGGLPVDYRVAAVETDPGGSTFHILRRCRGGEEDLGAFRVNLPGRFNVDNALVAAVCALELGFSADDVRAGLPGTRVPGRMEVFQDPQRQLVAIVDYAHNRLSFEALYQSVRQIYPGWRIEAVFGCPGGKGLQRRQELPDIVAAYADAAWITEEDAGEEELADISEALIAALTQAGCPSRRVDDREEAIALALAQAPPRTVVVITGKGRENYQKRGRDYVPVLSDVELVQRWLKPKEQ